MGVSSLRILGVDNRCAVVLAKAFIEDKEVVAVQMHWMGCVVICDMIAKDKSDCFVGPKVIDVPLWVVGVRCVPAVGKIKDRMAVLIFISVISVEEQIVTSNWASLLVVGMES